MVESEANYSLHARYNGDSCFLVPPDCWYTGVLIQISEHVILPMMRATHIKKYILNRHFFPFYVPQIKHFGPPASTHYLLTAKTPNCSQS